MTKLNQQRDSNKTVMVALLVATLGYFVDIYNFILFSIVRVPSLRDIGLSGEQILNQGILLLALQMAGMLIGGVLFEFLRYRKGRVAILFGSILLYSIANLLNSFVTSVEMYGLFRFLAGVGLAGELGAGITIVAETLPKNKRMYGSTFVAALGICGGLLAWYIADQFVWRAAYMIGGTMGLVLLLIRAGILVSSQAQNYDEDSHKRENIKLLFNKKRLRKFVAGLAVGLPYWYVVGLLITLSTEFAAAMGATEVVDAGKCVFYSYAGLFVGDLLIGFLSQFLKSRKKSLLIFLIASVLSMFAYFGLNNLSANGFYFLSFCIGMTCGYWAMFVMIAAEQFGRNVRPIIATTTPNFVRAAFVPISVVFVLLKPFMGMVPAAIAVGVVCFLIAFWGYKNVSETFGVDLDYDEAT